MSDFNSDFLKHFSFKDENRVEVDDFILDILNKTIKNEKRVKHSISVANLAYEIAISNGLEDPFLYFIAGIFHDLAKGLYKNELKKYMKKYYSDYVDLPGFSYHQFVGGYLTKKLFGICDARIIDAIECHCTGKANMNSIDMIIYAADKTDPLRGYDSSAMINALKTNYKDGFVFVLKENKEFLINKSKDLNSVENRLTKECFDYYLN